MRRQQRAIRRGRFWLLFVPIASTFLLEGALLLLVLHLLAGRVALPIAATPTLMLYLGALSLVVSALLAALRVRREGWTVLRCAHQLDRRYGLADRLASACSLQDRQGEWEQALVRDAVTRLTAILPGSASRPGPTRGLAAALTLFMLCGLPIFLWPPAEADDGGKAPRPLVLLQADGTRHGSRAGKQRSGGAAAAGAVRQARATAPSRDQARRPQRKQRGGQAGPRKQKPRTDRARKPRGEKQPRRGKKKRLLGKAQRMAVKRRKFQVRPLVGAGRFRLAQGQFYHAERAGSSAKGTRRWNAKLHRHYQRLAERQIERELIPDEDQRLVRRYLELIRPKK